MGLIAAIRRISGRKELETAYTEIALENLSHDVPVDPEHVERLKASIAVSGQLAPLIVWVEGQEIIDGFHRHTALVQLGAQTATCQLVSLSREEFEDARIASATMHKGVEFARVVLWCREAFERTKWAKRLPIERVFDLPSVRRPGIIRQWGLGEAEVAELDAWIEDKAEKWGLSTRQIQVMLTASKGLVSRRVLEMVGAGGLNQTSLAAIVSHTEDAGTQERLADKVVAERLNARQVRDLMRALADAKRVPVEGMTPEWILQEPWRKAHRALSRQKAAATKSQIEKEQASYDAPKAREQREREAIMDIVYHADRLSEAVEKVQSFDLLPKHPELIPRVNRAVDRLTTFLALLRGSEGQTALSLGAQLRQAEHEKAELKKRLEALRSTVGIARRIHEEALQSGER